MSDTGADRCSTGQNHITAATASVAGSMLMALGCSLATLVSVAILDIHLPHLRIPLSLLMPCSLFYGGLWYLLRAVITLPRSNGVTKMRSVSTALAVSEVGVLLFCLNISTLTALAVLMLMVAGNVVAFGFWLGRQPTWPFQQPK